MKSTLTLLLFLLTFASISQKKIVKIPRNISELSDSLDKYRFTNTTKCLSLLQDLKYEASVRDDNQYWAYYYYLSGFFEVDKGEFKSADHLFEKALKLLGQQDFIDHDLYFKIYYQQAYVKSMLGDKKQSNKYYWACYDEAQKLQDSSMLALASFGISNVLIEMGNYREAKKFANLTLEIDLALNDSTAIAYDYGVIAVMYFKLKQYDNAEEYYLKAIQYSDQEESFHEYCNLHLALADVSNANGKFEKTIEITDYVTELIGEGRLKRLAILSRIHRANASYKLGRKELAILEFDKIISECKANNLVREEIRSTILLGKMHEDVNSAYGYLENAKKLIEKTNIELYYPLLYRTYIQRASEFEKAQLSMDFKNEYISFLEEVEAKNQESMIEGMDANFELHSMTELNTKLELENAQKKLELSNQRSKDYLLFSLIAFLCLTFVVYYFYNRQNTKIKLLEYDNQISKLSQKITSLNQNSKSVIPVKDEIDARILSPLTPKEYEILKDILQKMTNPEIAAKHFISINTVKFHLKNIYLKLDEPNKKGVISKFT